jgi:hypothetical protein
MTAEPVFPDRASKQTWQARWCGGCVNGQNRCRIWEIAETGRVPTAWVPHRNAKAPDHLYRCSARKPVRRRAAPRRQPGLFAQPARRLRRLVPIYGWPDRADA